MLAFLSGCAKYEAKPLKRLNLAALSATEPSVALAHRALDKDACKRYLDRDVISKGYQPVQITLTNNSDRNLEFSKDNMTLPYACASDVAPKVHTSTVGRAVGYGVVGLILWPFLIPAVVDSVGSAEANNKLDQDFDKKELEDQLVRPHSTINGLVFVPEEDFRSDFAITLVDAKTHEKFVLTSENPLLTV